jgi:hypothetical protein
MGQDAACVVLCVCVCLTDTYASSSSLILTRCRESGVDALSTASLDVFILYVAHSLAISLPFISALSSLGLENDLLTLEYKLPPPKQRIDMSFRERLLSRSGSPGRLDAHRPRHLLLQVLGMENGEALLPPYLWRSLDLFCNAPLWLRLDVTARACCNTLSQTFS